MTCVLVTAVCEDTISFGPLVTICSSTDVKSDTFKIHLWVRVYWFKG